MQVTVRTFVQHIMMIDPNNTDATATAARYGFLTCMRYVHRRGGRWHPETIGNAAEGGHLECMKFAYANGAGWSVATTALACRAGSMPCLIYAHQHGAPWAERTTLECVLGMNPECLRYATFHGAPRHPDTVAAALMRFQTFVTHTQEAQRCKECLLHLLDNKYPYDPRNNRARQTLPPLLSMLRGIRIIQRMWRAHNSRQHARRCAAVQVIEDCYLAWVCRPGVGSLFIAARDAWDSQVCANDC